MAATSSDMASILDILLGCISFACIATVFGGVALHCCPIAEKARMSSKAGVPHPERLGVAGFLVLNLILGAAGATLFFRGLYSFSDPWLGEALVGGITLATLVWALVQTVQELCLILLWVVSVTACVCWTAYTVVAIWEITILCSPSASGAVPNPATEATDIDLESQVGCTNQATALSTSDVVHVLSNAEMTGGGGDTFGSSDGCSATPSHPRGITPQLQAEQEAHLIWSADQEISLSQSSGTAAYTPTASSHSDAENPFDGHGQSADARTTTETVIFTDVMIRHLGSRPWVQSVGETWHDMEACERRSGSKERQNEPAKDISRAQQPIARAQVVQTTSETRIETTLKNFSRNTSENTSTTTSKITTKRTSEVGTGGAPRPHLGVIRPVTGQVDNKTKSQCSSFAQHRYPDLPNGVSGNSRGRALTDPFKEYYADMTYYKEEQHIMSPLHEGKDTNYSFPHDSTSSIPNPPPATEITTQKNQPSPSSSSSTAASNSAHSPPTPTCVPAPSSFLHIYNSRSPSPRASSRIAAWEKHVLKQEQKRYSQRLKFALETQYRHKRNSDISTDLQGTLSIFQSTRMPEGKNRKRVGSRGRDWIPGMNDADFDEYPFAWDRVEAERLDEQWRRRRGELDGVFGRVGTGVGGGWMLKEDPTALEFEDEDWGVERGEWLKG